MPLGLFAAVQQKEVIFSFQNNSQGWCDLKRERKIMSIFYKKLSQVETSSTMGYGLQNCDLFSLKNGK